MEKQKHNVQKPTRGRGFSRGGGGGGRGRGKPQAAQARVTRERVIINY